MDTVLFIAHTQPDGTLAKLALETLAAACELKSKLGGATLQIGLVGAKASAAAAAISGCGAQTILTVSGRDFETSRYSSDSLALETLCRRTQAGFILAPATSRFSRTLPGLAVRLQGRVDTHVAGLTVAGSTVSIQRWYYRQRLLATQSRPQRPWILLIDSGVFAPWTGAGGAAQIEELPIELTDNLRRTEVKGVRSPAASSQTIKPDAKLLFVTGAGWTKKQADGQVHAQAAESIIGEFLQRSNCSLGSSKSLVDQSGEGQTVLPFLSHLNQVGQTGSTPRHPKGLATCCHGEEPHAVGWRFINERRAVNLDPNCGWARGKADVLYVADAFKVMAKVNELLK